MGRSCDEGAETFHDNFASVIIRKVSSTKAGNLSCGKNYE